MKTLADLKRTLKLGQKIEMLTYNGTTPLERARGVREVVGVQTNGVYISHTDGEFSKRRSWFDFPKATQLEIHSDKRFTVRDTNKDGEVWCVREYVLVD